MIAVVLAPAIVTAPAEMLVAEMFPFVMLAVPSCISAALSFPVMFVVPAVCVRFAKATGEVVPKVITSAATLPNDTAPVVLNFVSVVFVITPPFVKVIEPV